MFRFLQFREVYLIPQPKIPSRVPVTDLIGSCLGMPLDWFSPSTSTCQLPGNGRHEGLVCLKFMHRARQPTFIADRLFWSTGSRSLTLTCISLLTRDFPTRLHALCTFMRKRV